MMGQKVLRSLPIATHSLKLAYCQTGRCDMARLPDNIERLPNGKGGYRYIIYIYSRHVGACKLLRRDWGWQCFGNERQTFSIQGRTLAEIAEKGRKLAADIDEKAAIELERRLALAFDTVEANPNGGYTGTYLGEYYTINRTTKGIIQ